MQIYKVFFTIKISTTFAIEINLNDIIMEIYWSKFVEMLILYTPKALGAILLLVVGLWLAKKFTRIVKRRMEKHGVEPTLVQFIGSFLSIGLKILVILSAAMLFGLKVTAFIAVLSALAFAVGLALQGNLSHMASGVLIIFFKPFKIGDFIVTQGYKGTVKEIQIFNTILTTLDNRIIIIPNGAVMSGPIENLSANEIRKVPMTFGIGYPDDIDMAREVIKRVADACPHIDHSRPVDILVSELADSSVNFAVRPWCATSKYWDVYFYMHEHIKKEFDKAGVGIPFPQMDVHIKKEQ